MVYSLCLIIVTLILFCAAQLIKENFQLYEGSQCLILNTGKNGVCKQLKFCPKAIEGLRDRQEYPQTCSFIRKEPVVCCEIDDDQKELQIASEKPQTTTTYPFMYGPPILTIYKRPGEIQIKSEKPFNETISYKKCKEYENPDSCRSFQFVVGGTKARSGEYPHMALLGYGDATNKKWQCGGSLISERFVLTAAHCLESLDLGAVKFVRLGVLNKNKIADDESPQDFLITQTFTPTDYSSLSRYHDIALLKLDHDAVFTNKIKPGCIYAQTEIEDFVVPTATGWGAVGFADADSDHLLYIRLNIQPTDSCNSSYKSNIDKGLEFGIDPALQICAGGKVGEDTCQGDSGGPLQFRAYEFECSFWIIGITSFGKACGISNVPGVYTLVSAYTPWIEKIVWGQ